jgi:serine/threonine protein kinase
VIAVKAFRQSGENVALDWEREVNALAKMNELGQDHIVRFITAFQRGEPEDLEHYVVFEWATGGNLGNLWDKLPTPQLSASLMKWVINQLHGLAQALAAAHYMKNNVSYRHGDLKPDNILWFGDSSDYGTLKIGDWGEAKSHEQVTSLRHSTTARPSTIRYEPPEAGLQLLLPKEARHVRSRLYDMWGFGCITLEFIIWLLYGRNGLKRFNNSNRGRYGTSETYYEISPERIAKVHGVVSHWTEHMAKDILCSPGETALGDLLQIVRTGLLVVQLPEDGGSVPQALIEQPSPSQQIGLSVNIIQAEPAEAAVTHEGMPNQDKRLRATELEIRLRHIAQAERNACYWYQAQEPKPAPVDYGTSQHLSVPHTTPRSNPNSATLRAPGLDRTDYGHPTLDPENWTRILDNEFAADLLSKLEHSRVIPSDQMSPLVNLCTRCQEFRERLRDTRFDISYNRQMLQRNAGTDTCKLCCLLWETYRNTSDKSCQNVRFKREDSTLWMSGANYPTLSLFQSNGRPAFPR